MWATYHLFSGIFVWKWGCLGKTERKNGVHSYLKMKYWAQFLTKTYRKKIMQEYAGYVSWYRLCIFWVVSPREKHLCICWNLKPKPWRKSTCKEVSLNWAVIRYKKYNVDLRSCYPPTCNSLLNLHNSSHYTQPHSITYYC